MHDRGSPPAIERGSHRAGGAEDLGSWTGVRRVSAGFIEAVTRVVWRQDGQNEGRRAINSPAGAALTGP